MHNLFSLVVKVLVWKYLIVCVLVWSVGKLNVLRIENDSVIVLNSRGNEFGRPELHHIALRIQ